MSEFSEYDYSEGADEGYEEGGFEAEGAEPAEPTAPVYERDERFYAAVQEGIDRALAPFEAAPAGRDDSALEQPQDVDVEGLASDIRQWGDAVFDEVAQANGVEFDREAALARAGRLFNEKLAADPDVDRDELLEQAFAEGAVDAIAEKQAAPILQKLVAAELFRVGEQGNDYLAGEIEEAAGGLVDVLIEGGVDPHMAAAEAVSVAGTLVTGTRWAGVGVPSPTTIANYYGGQARALNEMNRNDQRLADRQAGPPPTSASTPQDLARKYAALARGNP